MTPTKSDEREKAPLPIEAEPAVLHVRLLSVERTNRKILSRIKRMGDEIRKDVTDGFRRCSDSRPCAKGQAQSQSASIDWSSWGPALQKVLVGAAIVGTLIGAAVTGVKSPQAQQVQISGGSNK